MNKNKITFWQLLTKYHVIIPIIQRDYAQGREGKEFIRKNFLEQIMKGLFSSGNNEKCEMDFVYGTVKDGALYPIDGQQRLTTLWLFHWYVAWKEGKLNDENIAILKKFTYETRSSSREFCEKLCDFKKKPIEISGSVVDAIENETWFYSEWKQDPTIQSMLRMLGGTCATDNEGNQDKRKGNFDGIEEVYNSVLWILNWYNIWERGGETGENERQLLNKYSCVLRESPQNFCGKLEENIKQLNCLKVKADLVNKINEQFSGWKQDTAVQSMLSLLQEIINGNEDNDNLNLANVFEEKLKNDDCPLQFSLLEIGTNELPVSDDLYIKMNARGKPLTDFENFKADLINWMNDEKNEIKPDDVVRYASLIDNGWTDVFWTPGDIGSFDIRWMAFLCRFFVIEAIEKNYQKTNKDIENILRSLHIHEDDKEQSFDYHYEKFDEFSSVISKNSLSRLSKVFKTWKELSSCNDFNIVASWGEECRFIPEMVDGKVSTLSMKTRVVFYGTLLFCEKFWSEDERIDTKDVLQKWEEWKRVLWNLAENTNESSNLDAFVGVIKMIKELSQNAEKILVFLADDSLGIESGASMEQVKEERAKAKLIINHDWRTEIQQAEAAAFLKGRLSVIIESSKNEDRPEKEKFVKILNGLTEAFKFHQGKDKDLLLKYFKNYLFYAADDDLPLIFDRNFFESAKWKDMFFSKAKPGVIAWLKSFWNGQYSQSPSADWAKNLYDHWDIICPQDNINEYMKIVKYHGWGNNKIFFYRTSYIRGAQLLSDSLRDSLREKLCSVLKSTSSVWHYPNYNFEIPLENGICILHRPDDTVAVCKNNVWLDAIGDFSLKEPLQPETLDSFCKKLSEI